MKKQLTKYAVIAFLGLTGIISCGDDDAPTPNNGTESKAVLQLNNESLNFNEVQENTTKELTFKVSNTGNAVLNITSANLTGTNKSEFTTTATTTSIEAGKSETFKVTFKPTSVGDKSASLDLVTNGGDKSITLTGKGIQTPVATLNVNKESLAFGEIIENTTKTLTFEVSNTGNAILEITSANLTGTNKSEFTTATTTSIEAGKSETFEVTFIPTSAGDKTASLELVTNGGNKNITLTGKSTPAPVATLNVNKESLAFGEIIENTTKTLTFEVSNTGNAILEINAVNLTGTNNSEFTTTATTKNIEAGTSEIFEVTFKPTSAGDKTASLELVTNGGNKTIALTGTSKTQNTTPNSFHQKDGFIFAYEFENNLNISNNGNSQEFLTPEGNTPSYISRINSNSVGVNINGLKLSGNTVLSDGISQITISFWYKASGGDRTTLLKLASTHGIQDLRVVKDTNKHFVDGHLVHQSYQESYNVSNNTGFNHGYWTHVLASIDYDPNDYNTITFNLYINGTVARSTTYNGVNQNYLESDVRLFDPNHDINIMINPDKVGNLQIDNLRVYSRGINTGAEVSEFLND